MASESNLPGTIFTGKNFEEWKTEMQILLEIKELWYLTEKEPETENLTGKDAVELQKKLSHAAGLLKFSMAKDQRALIHDKKTPHEIWTTMEKTFAGKKTNRLIPLLRELWNLTVEDEGNISLFLNKVTDLWNKVREIKRDLLNEELLFSLIMSKLPASYSTFQTIYNSDEYLELTKFVELKELILAEEAKLRHHGLVGSTSSHALAATSYKKEAKPDANPSHGSGPRKDKKKFAGVCNFCKKVGHKERNCWNKKKAESQDKGKGVSAFSTRVLSTSPGSSGIKDEWILDSGAQRHITFRKDDFQAWDQNVGSPEIILGDASKVPVAGVGTVTLRGGSLDGVYYAPQMDHNLMSAREICKRKLKIELYEDKFLIKDPKNKFELVASGKVKDDLWVMVPTP